MHKTEMITVNKFTTIYAKLLKEYGPQGWWPLSGKPRNTRCEKGKGLHMPKHHNGPPLNDMDRFEIMIGAILTQNTAWTNVEKAIEQLGKNKLIDPDRIIKTDKQKIAKLIRSAGYYNQKSERLKMIAGFVKQNSMKKLLAKKTEKLREMLLSLNGVGPETADSMVLYAFGKPTFVIDAYTRRIFSRLGICNKDAPYESLRQMFMKNVKKDVAVYKEYHALIVEHAKRHDRTKPECKGCLISELCAKIT
jgi:endonuclease-3 related protein